MNDLTTSGNARGRWSNLTAEQVEAIRNHPGGRHKAAKDLDVPAWLVGMIRAGKYEVKPKERQ